MPHYDVWITRTHTQSYYVQADSEAKALEKSLSGQSPVINEIGSRITETEVLQLPPTEGGDDGTPSTSCLE